MIQHDGKTVPRKNVAPIPEQFLALLIGSAPGKLCALRVGANPQAVALSAKAAAAQREAYLRGVGVGVGVKVASLDELRSSVIFGERQQAYRGQHWRLDHEQRQRVRGAPARRAGATQTRGPRANGAQGSWKSGSR